MYKSIAAIVCGLMVGVISRPAVGQTCPYTITNIVCPKLAGKHLNPADSFVEITGVNSAPPKTDIADGDTILIDSAGTVGGPWTFEFDTNSSVTSGNIAVLLPSVDNTAATRALAATI